MTKNILIVKNAPKAAQFAKTNLNVQNVVKKLTDK